MYLFTHLTMGAKVQYKLSLAQYQVMINAKEYRVTNLLILNYEGHAEVSG